jgi:hypothetical protein
MMKFLIGWATIAAVLVSPCAWDSDPREITAAGLVMHAAASSRPAPPVFAPARQPASSSAL